jgi:hypothetical protein
MAAKLAHLRPGHKRGGITLRRCRQARPGEQDFYFKTLPLQPIDDSVVEGQMAGRPWSWEFISDEQDAQEAMPF